MNCGAINTGDTYIFKTCRYALENAAKMDENRLTTRGKPSILCREKAFFDGMHSRCKGYKTLTLWMHHPGMRKMQRLATMDCKRESTDMIALFFEIFNEALAEVVGEKRYKFNPSMICVDEAGANIQGLRKNFGEEFMKKVVTCQFHFKQCARQQLKNIDENDKATFMHLVNKICLAQTVAEYKKFDKPCTNLAWCSFPSESNSEQIHLISPPQEFTRQQPKKYNRPRSQHNQLAGNLPKFNQKNTSYNEIYEGHRRSPFRQWPRQGLVHVGHCRSPYRQWL